MKEQAWYMLGIAALIIASMAIGLDMEKVGEYLLWVMQHFGSVLGG